MVYLNWSVAICLIQVSASILAGVAAFSDYWGVIPSTSSHFGLIIACGETYECFKVTGTEDVLNLLIAVMLIGIVAPFPCCILEFSRGLRYNLFHCFVSALMAILAFAAMIHAIVLLKNIQFNYSWSFALGWLAVIVALASGILSFFTRQKGNTEDPESPEALQAALDEMIVVSRMSNTGQSFPVIVRGYSNIKF